MDPDKRNFGTERAFLGPMQPACHGNSYWRRELDGLNHKEFFRLAWKRIIPLEARPRQCLHVVCPEFPSLIKPVARVLLYPFGWSTWISLLAEGNHSLADLADLLDHLAKDKVFRLEGRSEMLTRGELFRLFSEGTVKDAFPGETAGQTDDFLSVTTVLRKYGGSLSLNALSPGVEDQLKRLSRPGQKPSRKPLAELQVLLGRGDRDEAFDFAIQDNLGIFLWAEHLLSGGRWDREHLRCYHNNTFRSILQAWQLTAFLKKAEAEPPWCDELLSLAGNAAIQLEASMDSEDRYRNRMTRRFLGGREVQRALAAIHRRLEVEEARQRREEEAERQSRAAQRRKPEQERGERTIPPAAKGPPRVRAYPPGLETFYGDEWI